MSQHYVVERGLKWTIVLEFPVCDVVSVQAFVIEDNKQLILEGQLHVALQTIGKEACSLTPKEVQ